MDIPGTAELFGAIDYSFGDLPLFRLSITHKSFANEHPDRGQGHNERLEFLGDAVLDFIISDLLVEKFPHHSEGDLSKIRAGLVSESGLAEISRELGLGPTILMGRGEEKSGGREKNSILSDALEALIAAIYLDSRSRSDTEEIRRVISHIFAGRIERVAEAVGGEDFKTELQELVQKRYKDTVIYRITSEAGPDHEKMFEAAVVFRDQEYGRGMGRSKKQAEQEAAKTALTAFQ